MANETVTQQILSKLVLDDSQYQAAAKRITAANQGMDTSADQVVSSITAEARAFASSGGALEQFAARLDRTVRAQQDYARNVDRINRLADQEGSSLQQRAVALEAAQRQYQRLNQTMVQGAGAAASALGNTGNALRQVGFQVQDIFVQLQGGQSPFLVLSQQGGQLVQALGSPMVALAGTAVLIAAATIKALAFSDAVEDAAEAQKKFGEAIDGSNKFLRSQDDLRWIERSKDMEKQLVALREEAEKLAPKIYDLQKAAEAAQQAFTVPENAEFGILGGQENAGALNAAIARYEEIRRKSLDLEARIGTLNKGGRGPNQDEIERTVQNLEAEQQALRRLVEVSKQSQEGIDRVTDARKAHETIRQLKLTADEKEGQTIIRLIGINAELERQAKRIQAAREGEIARANAAAAAIEKSSEEATKWMRDRAIAADRLAVVTQTDIDLLGKQADAAQQSTVEFNELTGTYRLVTKALDELNYAASLEKGGLDPERARELARAWAEGKQNLDRITDAQKQFVDRLNKQQELMLEPFKNAIQGIQGAFADMFEGLFSGTVDLFSSLKRVAIRFASEIATLLIFRPAVGSALQSFGLGGLAQQMGVGGGGFGGLGGLFGGGQGLGVGGVDAGYMPPGMSGLFGGNFLSVGGGAIGGFAAPQILRQLGLGIGKGSPVGSGIGSIGGAVLGNMLLPGIGGILGGVAGGFLGDIFGGLFGGGGKDEDEIAREQYMQQRAQSLASLNTQLNAFIARGSGPQSSIGQQIRAIGDEGQNLKQQFYDLNDVSRMDEITAATNAQIKKLTDDFVKSLKDQALAITDAGGEIKRTLDRNAEELRKSAREAGVGLAEAEALIAAQLNQARENIDRQNALALGNLTGNPSAGYADLVRQQTERLSTVKSLGADIVQAEALAAAERLEYFKRLTDAQRELLRASLSEAERALLDLADAGQTGADQLAAAASAMDAFGESIDDFLAGLKLSDLSTLSPGAKYAQAAAQFEQTMAGVERGDADAIARYQQDAQVFLSASRGIYGSGDQYAQDFQRVLSQSEMLQLMSADKSTALGRAGIDLSSIMASGSGALLDNKVTAAEADVLLATIDELAARLNDLVDPSHAAVEELSDLRDRIVATRDATEQANAAQPPGAELPNLNPTPLPANDNSGLPGWQQGALAGGPSAEFRNALVGALYPGLSYDQAPDAARSAVDQLFSGDAYSYLMMGGENAVNTLINSKLYSADDLYSRYGGISFNGAESIGKLLEEWWGPLGDMGGNGLSPSSTPSATAPATQQAFSEVFGKTKDLFAEMSQMGMIKGQTVPGLPSLPSNLSQTLAQQINAIAAELGVATAAQDLMDALQDYVEKGYVNPNNLKDALQAMVDSGVSPGTGTTGLGGQVGTNATGNPADAEVGFASGGPILGGIPGRDSIPVWVEPQERVLSVEEAAMYPDMLRVYAGSNDNGAVVAELRRANQKIGELSRQIAELRSERRSDAEKAGDQRRRIAEVIDRPKEMKRRSSAQ